MKSDHAGADFPILVVSLQVCGCTYNSDVEIYFKIDSKPHHPVEGSGQDLGPGEGRRVRRVVSAPQGGALHLRYWAMIFPTLRS